jgi:deoxyribonuclease IV
LERCELLGIPYLIAHPGSHVGSGEETGIKTIARSIDEAHKACAGFKVKVAVEITAGQGSNLGYKFEQMAAIFDAIKENERLGLCFDTEHAFAAGYDLRTDEGYQRTFTELDEIIGIKRLAAFHLNDSAKPFHSRVDRHEHIGKGHLGLDAFRRVLNDPRFAGLPMCLETEPGPEMEDIIADLRQLHKLLNSNN